MQELRPQVSIDWRAEAVDAGDSSRRISIELLVRGATRGRERDAYVRLPGRGREGRRQRGDDEARCATCFGSSSGTR